MIQEIFDRCLELAAKHSQLVTIGGGEPTLHPQIIPWTLQAVDALSDVYMDHDGPAVLVITNGKKKDKAIRLAKLARMGCIDAELSQDEFHEPIDEKTVQAFKRFAGIRDVTGGGRRPVYAMGRAASVDFYRETRKGCVCNTLFIAPNGDFYGCGCKKEKLGNILVDPVPNNLCNEDDGHKDEKEPILELA